MSAGRSRGALLGLPVVKTFGAPELCRLISFIEYVVPRLVTFLTAIATRTTTFGSKVFLRGIFMARLPVGVLMVPTENGGRRSSPADSILYGMGEGLSDVHVQVGMGVG